VVSEYEGSGDWISEDDEESLYDVHCIEASPDALRVQQEGERPFWVPRSVVCDSSEVRNQGDRGRLDLKTWWLEKGQR
jgi:hypothetical protein